LTKPTSSGMPLWRGHGANAADVRVVHYGAATAGDTDCPGGSRRSCSRQSVGEERALLCYGRGRRRATIASAALAPREAAEVSLDGHSRDVEDVVLPNKIRLLVHVSFSDRDTKLVR
jgi:hypothetical protein